jgi:SAM-dependent methyltransferase
LTNLESSSGHTVNGDRRLSYWDRVRWIFLNWLNNTRATSNLDPSLELVRFRVGSVTSQWSKIDAAASPSRRFSDLFWLALPWQRIAGELSGTVNVLEVGCGTGRYGLLMQECLGDELAGYVGLDAVRHPEWDSRGSNPKHRFVCTDSGSTDKYLPDANLIITQSALEHFEADLVFFRQIAGYVATTSRPTIQIHLMPSAGCLTTFPWHGVRQYTPRTTSRITRLFGTETSKRLYFLGSGACNRIHRRYITYPWLLGRSDRRRMHSAAYDRELRHAVERDDTEPKQAEACFHALVLQSRLGRDIFLRP